MYVLGIFVVLGTDTKPILFFAEDVINVKKYYDRYVYFLKIDKIKAIGKFFKSIRHGIFRAEGLGRVGFTNCLKEIVIFAGRDARNVTSMLIFCDSFYVLF